MMRKALKSGSRWVLIFVVALVGLLTVGIAILPEVFRRGTFLPSFSLGSTTVPAMPIGYYILSLLTLAAFVGVVISLFVERYERLMVVLFIVLRIAVEVWQYLLGRHSLLYLAGTTFAHLLVGALVLLFFSGRMRLPPGQIGPDEDIP